VLVRLAGEVRDAGDAVVRRRAAQLLLRDLFVGHGADDFGAGDEHVRGVFDHHVEVRDGGAVDGPAGAGAHDATDLRHDARGQDVPQEDVRVPGQAPHALLYARAAGVVEADDGRADAHREVHDLADFFGVGLGEGAAEDREVLREDEDLTAVYQPVAGDDAVAVKLLPVEAEVRGAVRDEAVELLEGAFVEEEGETLAGGPFARLMLSSDAGLTPAGLGQTVALRQLFGLP
jgi:hypothetical protein